MRRLRNKQTGKIGTLIVDGAYKFVTNLVVEDDEGNRLGEYDSLAGLNAEWEDAPEEPKEYWRITDLGEVKSVRLDQHHQNIKKCKEIGNYFLSREEAEDAVEKLKAFKRLEDKGFKFEDLDVYLNEPWKKCELGINAVMPDDAYTDEEANRDLDICFGGDIFVSGVKNET